MSNTKTTELIELVEKYHPASVRGLAVLSPIIISIAYGGVLAVRELVHIGGFTSLALVLLPAILYWLYFIYKRLLWNIVFSKRVNIVLAYNLQGLNEQRNKQKIRSFITELRNQISLRNLGGHINPIIAPEDMMFRDHSAAEAKVLLGLRGSTLLIWGSVRRQKGGLGIRTAFSYEFGYPDWVNEENAKKIFSQKIEKILSSGLFSLDSKVIVEGNVFQDHVLPTSLFLLGLTSVSLNKFEDAKYFLEEFLSYYNSERNLLRKIELGRAFVETRELLIRILKDEIVKIIPVVNERCHVLAERILALDQNDYDALIIEAYNFEALGRRQEAIRCNEQAASHAPRHASNHLFNRAYFLLSDGDFVNALKIYEDIPDKSPTMTSSVSNYCHSRYTDTSNPAFLFADGYIQARWDDVKYGQKTLKKFIRIAKSDARLDPLINAANALIKSH